MDGRFWVITEEKICQFDGICIVDTGATTFVPLWNYILENEILCFLAARSRRVFVHSVIAGGQAMSDTLNGLERLAETTTEKNVIVWLNEFRRSLERWEAIRAVPRGRRAGSQASRHSRYSRAQSQHLW